MARRKARTRPRRRRCSETEHNGYKIEARPYADGGQYQVAGTVSKMVNGEKKEHRFVRADRFGSLEDAAEVALRKGAQLVDQQGDKIFGA